MGWLGAESAREPAPLVCLMSSVVLAYDVFRKVLDRSATVPHRCENGHLQALEAYPTVR
jgi:hypothetical protein